MAGAKTLLLKTMLRARLNGGAPPKATTAYRLFIMFAFFSSFSIDVIKVSKLLIRVMSWLHIFASTMKTISLVSSKASDVMFRKAPSGT